MQEDTERDLQEPAQGNETKCKVCKADFAPKTKKGVYCSAKCRQASFFRRRHNFSDMFNQIGKEFKNITQDRPNQIEIHKKMDELIVRWMKEFQGLADEANGEGRNRSQRYT